MKNKKTYSIKNKLIIAFLPITVFALIVITLFVNNKFTSHIIKKEFVNSSKKEIVQVDNAINLFLQSIKYDCNFLASEPIMSLADNTINSYADFNRSVKMTPSRNGGAEQKIFEFMDRFARTHPNYAYVYIGTKDGGFVQWPEGNSMKNYDPRKRPWFKKAFKNPGKIIMTDPYYYPADKTAMITISRTFKDKAGKYYGAQGVDVSLKGLTEIIKKIRMGKSGYVVLVHYKGKIMAHPKNSKLNFKHFKKMNLKQLENILKVNSLYTSVKIDEIPYIVNVYTSPTTKWKFLTFVPKSELLADARSIMTTIWLFVIIFIFILVPLIFIVAFSLTKPLKIIVEKIMKMSTGDLSEKIYISSKDEIGSLSVSINTFKEQVKQIISRLKTTTKEVGDSTDVLTETVRVSSDSVENMDNSIKDISLSIDAQKEFVEQTRNSIINIVDSIKHISQNIDQQNNTVEDSSIAISRLADSINSVADTTARAKNISANLTIVAREGGEAIQTAIEAIHEIEDSSKRVNEIVNLITGIAEQTNLLAMNAAIEAAHAGEYGKGFAVVADEIRKLAENSSSSAKDITLLIKEITNKINKTTELTDRAIKGLDKILADVDQSNEINSEISNAMSSQTMVVGEILKLVDSLVDVTNNVKDSVKTQEKDSGEIINVVDNLAEYTKKIVEAIHDISEKGSGLIKTVNEINDVTKINERIVDNFEKIANSFILEQLESSDKFDTGITEISPFAN